MIVLAFCLIPGLLPGFTAAGQIPELPELNWEKRSDWVDVTKDVSPAAVGDGVADDTKALQAAFDRVAARGSAFSTVYIPPGTYRITRQIQPIRVDGGASSMHIRGHGRGTRIVWDGPENGTMFRVNRFTASSYIGTVWDGRGKAAYGFLHEGGYESKSKHHYQAFMNFREQGSGTSPGPRPSSGYTESTEWRNCLFVNNGKGLAITCGWPQRVGNNMDWVISVDGCEFHDNHYGIWNRGCMYVRNCHFQSSGSAPSQGADISFHVPNMLDRGSITNGSSVRRCTSVGSTIFFQGHGPQVTIQDCHVSGWTNPNGVVIWQGENSSNGLNSPLLIFDCVFTNAPSANPPIRLDNNPASVVTHSNNSTSTPSLFGGSTERLFEVPKGQRGGSVTSSQQRFFRSEVSIPTKVFDAKMDFGAAGDGSTDDTDAVQNTINAARQHGRGAIAYLPRGNYRLGRTINISGGDYYVGGAGNHNTRITWGGSGNGPIILVSDPQNVTMEYLSIHAGGTIVGIRQVSATPQPSRMHYEHIKFDIGGTWNTPNTFTGNGAFEAVGLSKGSVLTAYCFEAWTRGLSFDNCSSTRILLSHVGSHSQGVLRLKGTQSDRSGFFGVLTGHTRYRIEDNQSFVGSDLYTEQMDSPSLGAQSKGPYVYMSGSPALPAGRVTMSSVRIDAIEKAENEGPQYDEYYTVNNYHGTLSGVLQLFVCRPQLQNNTTNKRKAFRFVCSGQAPLDVLLMGSPFQEVGPSIEGGNNVMRHVLACSRRPRQQHFFPTHPGVPILHEPIPDVLHDNSLLLASQALDDFRELGEQDLLLNYPELKPVSILASAPPRLSNTIPSRRLTTRMPAACAGCVAASHSRQTPLRKLLPAGDCSVKIVSLLLP